MGAAPITVTQIRGTNDAIFPTQPQPINPGQVTTILTQDPNRPGTYTVAHGGLNVMPAPIPKIKTEVDLETSAQPTLVTEEQLQQLQQPQLPMNPHIVPTNSKKLIPTLNLL